MTDDKEYYDHVHILDRFYMFLSLKNIVLNAYSELVQVKPKNNGEFNVFLEKLLNYLNSTYTFKEYLNNKLPIGKIIHDEYFQYGHSKYNLFYKFVFEFRNLVIHEYFIPRVYDLNTGEVFINTKEIIESKKLINKNIEDVKEKNRNKRLINLCQDVYKNVDIRAGDYVLLYELISKATSAIYAISEEVVYHEYDTHISDSLEYLMNYYNHMNEDNIKKNLEIYFDYFYRNTDENNPIKCEMSRLYDKFLSIVSVKEKTN